MNKDRETYEELRKTSQEIGRLLKDENLTPEERQELENVQAGVAGALLNTWIPFGLVRRSIMVAIFMGGLYGLIGGSRYLLFIWLLLPFFSPRIVGLSFHAMGRLFRQ